MAINYCSASEAVGIVHSGERIFIHGSAATPNYLLNTLLARAGEIQNIEIVAISMHGDIHWDKPEILNSFYLNSLFVSPNVRDWVNGPHGEYVPVFLSEIPLLFERNILPLDVAIVQVSPPDAEGYVTLGTSVDAALSAVKTSKKVIAQVNPRMPVVHGDGRLHHSIFTALVWHEAQLPEVNYADSCGDKELQIGQNVAALIEDGSTLQMGIGGIPDAVLKSLGSHRGLGIHTEMFSDGVLPLIEQGVITNEHKQIHTGKIVTSFVLGTQKVYDFVDDNRNVLCLDVSFVNDTSIIRQNPKVVAINSAIEIDLTGQVCADSIGIYQYSGIGGQMDFMRGASLSRGGKPIIALPSTTSKGISRIVPTLREGAGVVTTRGHIHHVITEYGAVDLYGKNLEQRAKLLISIAGPEHRELLAQDYYSRFGKLL
jgi:acyl-CoA hydrolase